MRVPTATLTPSSSSRSIPFILPNYATLEDDFLTTVLYEELYALILHNEPEIFSYNDDLNTYIPVRNVPRNTNVKVSIERTVHLNLKRLPCEEDPKYSIGSCQRRCFLKSINCSMGIIDMGETGGKPTCMASDFPWYVTKTSEFVRANNETGGIPLVKCNCPQPCVRDRISYTPQIDMTLSNNESVGIVITMSRVRRTNVEVLAYDLKALLADIGGYLGLLLGASLHSLYGAGERLTKRVLRRRSGRKDTEEDPGDGSKRASNMELEEIACVLPHRYQEHVCDMDANDY